MSNDLNHCSFIGRLGREVEIRYLANGDAVANFSIAVGESYTDKNSGEKKESVEWVRCIAWRKLAEVCAKYLHKGSQIFVSGKLKTRKWTDKENVERYSTEIQVDRMQMLGSKTKDSAPAEHGSKRTPTPESKKTGGKFDDMDDDIPF